MQEDPKDKVLAMIEAYITGDPEVLKTVKKTASDKKRGCPKKTEIGRNRYDGDLTATGKKAEKKLDAIWKEIGDCQRCGLSKKRNCIVFGVGAPDADLIFIGEAPGANEDKTGIPFVGRAGQLLTQLITNIGLTRDDVYIANICKCRPPANRTPLPDEMQTCEQFLQKQLAAIRPKVICTLGNVATQTLTGTKVGITKLRGQKLDYEGIPLVPTYHPAYLLRPNGRSQQGNVMRDFEMVKEIIEEARAGE